MHMDTRRFFERIRSTTIPEEGFNTVQLTDEFQLGITRCDTIAASMIIHLIDRYEHATIYEIVEVLNTAHWWATTYGALLFTYGPLTQTREGHPHTTIDTMLLTMDGGTITGARSADAVLRHPGIILTITTAGTTYDIAFKTNDMEPTLSTLRDVLTIHTEIDVESVFHRKHKTGETAWLFQFGMDYTQSVPYQTIRTLYLRGTAVSLSEKQKPEEGG